MNKMTVFKKSTYYTSSMAWYVKRSSVSFLYFYLEIGTN